VNALLYTFEAYRLVLRVLVLVMSGQFVAATLLYLRQRRRRAPSPPDPAEWPTVTVQLPMRNEYYTAARAIGAVAALDYPRDRLEIQILDDSDDATVAVVAAEVARLSALGFRVAHVRRFDPMGFKAGALENGFNQSTSELIAIFDADFVPAKDFLRRTVPYFSDPEVGLVQGRWEHVNRNESWFTRLEAQVLDGLMVVEQTAKSGAGLPFQFNGTAGVWRRSAIERAGGWTFDSLTEDFDLSLRARIAGAKLVHLPDVAVLSELPSTLGLFRVQQRRWALGTAQLLRKRFFAVLRAPLPFGERLSLVLQLCRHFGYPLLVVMMLTVPLTTFVYIRTPIEYGALNAVVLGIAMGSVALQQGVAAHALGQSTVRAVAMAPLTIALAIGLAPTYTVALGYGLLDRAGPFHRTPKVPRPPLPGEPTYRAKRSVLTLVETAIGLAYAAFTVVAIGRGIFVEASFLAFVSCAYLWVGIGSFYVSGVNGRARPSAAVTSADGPRPDRAFARDDDLAVRMDSAPRS
jgi:cellulose synthase/poly-beta-1,6-N-acetylglucosamine synthase-like glycosyltransferase